MRMNEAQDVFPHTWSAEVLKLAPLISPAIQFTYPQRVPGEEDALGRGALLVSVKPARGPNFLATCALGFRDPSLPSGVWSCPSPNHMLAVAGGYAYYVDMRQPERADLLEQRPVTSLTSIPQCGLILLAGFHNILAVGAEGVRWRTARLSWEGVTMGEPQKDCLLGFGWDMFTDKEKPFTVDLRTGKHQGGGYLAGDSSSHSSS